MKLGGGVDCEARRGILLIRYRTGDVSRFISEPHACGTHLKTLERITHRLSGRVRIGDHPLTMTDLEEALFAIDGVLNFTAVITRENSCACWHVEVKTTDGYKVMPVVHAVLKAAALSVASACRLCW